MAEKLDLRIERTYRMLRDAFTRLMAEKPYEEITVSELCDAAIIRRTTFYKHFADKDEFFAFYVRRTREEFQERVEPHGTHETPANFSDRMFHELVAFVQENDRLVRRALASSAFATMDAILSEEISRSLRQRLEEEAGAVARFGCSPQALADFMAGGMLRALYRWLQDGNEDVEALEADLRAITERLLG